MPVTGYNKNFRVRTGLSVGNDKATIDGTTGSIESDGDLTITGGDIFQSGATPALTLSGSNTTVRNDLTINGDNINLAQSTLIGYSENNDRANRPEVQSTTGNSSGFRVLAPNGTTSANSNLTVFGSNDINNGEFLSIQGSGSTTSPFAVRTGKYTAGVLGASGKSISFTDNATLYATINPTGPTNGTDLTTKSYVDGLVPDVPTYDTNVVSVTGGAELDLRSFDGFSYAIVGSTQFIGGTNITIAETSPNVITIDGTDLNTTYTISSASTTGGANLTLTGSDSSTDSVAYKGSGATTVTSTDANTITISSTDTNTTYTQDASSTTGGANLNLVGSDSTTDSIKFAGGTNVSITATDANTITIAATDTNTTYTVDASSTTGGANLNLVGSDSTTDTVAYKGSGATTVTATDANTITISSTDTNTTYTQDVSSTTGGANLNLVGSDSTTDSVKFAGGTNVSIVATDANTMTINATDTNTTYDFAASSTTGGANLNLTGSDSTTDTVKLTNGGHITATYTSATEVTLGSDATDANTVSTIVARDASGNFSAGTITATLSGNATTATTATQVSNSLTAGTHLSGGPYNGSAAVTLTTDATDANTAGTIVARDGSGNFSAGTITANLANMSYVLGDLQATTNSSYTFPSLALATVSTNNGLDAASSMPTGTTFGAGAQQQLVQYYGDTFAGTNTTAALSLKSAAGNSTTGGTVPFTGLAQTAASAVQSGVALGTLNFNGYATSGWSDVIASRNQAGGFTALHAAQIQNYTTEAFADGTLTLSGATITSVSRVNVAQTVTNIAGTKGQLTIPSTLVGVGTAVVVTGTNSGTGTGITAGNYYVIANNGGAGASTQITLSATVGGAPINTTAGTVTGLTFTRQLITVGYSAQTSIPFGINALITVANITNVTAGTYMAVGTSTTTSVTIGALSTGAVSLPGTQSLSTPTVTNAGTGWRIRAFPLATTMNNANRVDVIDAKPGGTTLRADSFTFNTGAYGNTGVGVTGNNIVYNRVYGQWQYNTSITGITANTPAVFPLGTADFNNIATVGSTSRLIPGAAGKYNFQFSLQCSNSNSSAYDAYIWLRKNGADVTGSMGRISVPGSHASVDGKIISAWNYILDPANTTDYFELAYAVENTAITFTSFAANSAGFTSPSTATLITTLTPVGA